MAETKVVKRPPAEVTPGWPESAIFGPMLPFGDIFGVNPFALMREFTKEMDRAFSRFPNTEFAPPKTWVPAIEMKQANGNLVVIAELPGIKPEDVKVEVSGDALSIEGERKQEKKEEKPGYYRSERSYGRFYRTIPIPEGAEADQIKAYMKNGVLEITIPVPEVKPTSKQIPVTAGEGVKEQEKRTAA